MNRFIVSTMVCVIMSCHVHAQDWAKALLDKSPRHQEFVKVKHDDREVQSFIVYPEVKDKATAVVVIHEIFGLSDWVRSLTDELAEAGYIAIAPDLLCRMGPKGGGTSDFSLVQLQPGRLNGNDIPKQVLGTDGVGIAGDAFDSKLVRRLVELGILDADKDLTGNLWFSLGQLAAMARIQRLRTGFGLNYAALGLVIDLLDRITVLEAGLRHSSRRTGGRPWT